MKSLFLISCVALGLLFQQDDRWERVIKEDGIETKIGTDPHTSLPMFESTVIIEQGMHELFARLNDHAKLKDWVYGVAESERVEMVDEASIVYYRLDLPWPVKDRDLVTRQSAFVEKDSIVLTVAGIESAYKSGAGAVRIETVLTNWEFHKLSEKSTKVVYRSYADTAGIPDWIVKLFLAKNPQVTLTNLRGE